MLDSAFMPVLAFELILPPLCSLFGALFVLMLGAFTHNKHPKTLGFLSALSVIISCIFCFFLRNYDGETGFFDMVIFDSFSFLAQFLILLSALGFILLSISPKLPQSYKSAIIFVLVVLSMILPNLLALTQKDVKRMLAYSSITHASFLLAMIFVNSVQALEGFFLYWFMFVFANIGAFGMLWILRLDSPDCTLSRFVGLGRRAPKLACLFALFLLALIGIPPLSVFWGKMYVMRAAIDSDYVFLALIMALNSAIAAYYYLRVIVAMFLLSDSKSLDSNSLDSQQEVQTAEFDTSFMPLFVVSVCAIFVIISCVLAQKLLSFLEIFI